MSRILYLALEFPPVQTTGAFRSLELVARLPALGLDCTVVSIHPDDGARIFKAPLNDGLMERLNDTGFGIRRLRDAKSIPSRETALQSYVRMMTKLDDSFARRLRVSLADTIRDLSTLGRFDAVVASLPPFGAGTLGAQAADALGCRLILDMRDAWSEWESAGSLTYFHYAANRRNERATFRRADAIITVTHQLANLFRASHPALPAHRFHVVPNGFDGQEFEPRTISTEFSKDTIDIAYLGSFYFTPNADVPWHKRLAAPHRLLHYRRGLEDWSYRSPLYFFKAWAALDRLMPDIGARLRFHHIGSEPAWLNEMAAAFGVADRCTAWGFQPKQKVQNILSNMDAMLSTSMKRLDGEDYCLASKTFDYILTGKPILAFVTPGAQREFLEGSGAALIFDPDQPAEAAASMAELFVSGAALHLNTAYVNAFSRDETAKRFVQVVNNVCSSS
jgi:glycosyltransferase involved in cell wall biosynthesis